MAEDRHPIRFPSAGPSSTVAIHVAPLIDVVFLLICFYLLVTQLISDQKDPLVQLPSMSNTVARPEAPAELVINLRHDGSLGVGGRAVSLAALRAMLIEQRGAAESANKPFRAVIRADCRQRYGKLAEVLEVCQQSGVPQVILRTKHEDKA
jgi:biopolymer transport protein ExbD